MKKKYAVKEYDEIKKYLPLLEKIPNYQNYFLVNDVSICDPDDLDDEQRMLLEKFAALRGEHIDPPEQGLMSKLRGAFK
jgi:hypothetical protein